jgi:hypothetical protein
VKKTNCLLDKVKLLAADSEDLPTGLAAFQLKSIFEAKVKELENKIVPIAEEFQSKALENIESTLTPSLQSGAKKGSSAALFTVTSWSSKNKRKPDGRDPNKNGKFSLISTLTVWIRYPTQVRFRPRSPLVYLRRNGQEGWGFLF